MRRRTSPDEVAAQALALLAEAGATLATAESLTGGRLAAAVTSVPGASASYLGGFVTYATELKEALLGVPGTLVEQYGVVSGECARAMAEGCRAVTGASYAVATTGVAGPELQEGKPLGTVFVGVAAGRHRGLDGAGRRPAADPGPRLSGGAGRALRHPPPGTTPARVALGLHRSARAPSGP
jgi:nicotinamide-nucleotide amidase